MASLIKLYSAFTVASTNGVTLAAKYWNHDNIKEADESLQKPVVLFVHQYAVMGGEGALMEGMARQMHKDGFDSITFDLRGAGQSAGSCSYTNGAEADDVKAMVNYVETELKRQVILVLL